MSRLYLPDVTLVCIDNVAYDLTHLALRDCLAQASYAEFVRLFPDADHTYEWLLQNTVPRTVHTSHALIFQYDSWVLNASLWQNEWLQYDYIGAPWPWYKDNLQVGNGGFSLRSKRLMDFLAENSDEYPCSAPEDANLCRKYRPALEALGFRWAPIEVARVFSFERELPRPTFGFHGLFNWPYVLTNEALAERMALATEYVRSKSEWKELQR